MEMAVPQSVPQHAAATHSTYVISPVETASHCIVIPPSLLPITAYEYTNLIKVIITPNIDYPKAVELGIARPSQTAD